MKITFSVILLLITLVLISAFVIAAGSSTGAGSSSTKTTTSDTVSPNTTTSDSTDAEPVTIEDNKEVDCESPSSRKDRIRCRLAKAQESGEEYEAPHGIVPEACRRLKSPTSCIALYDKSHECYELSGVGKDRCFKKVSNFKRSSLASEHSEDRPQLARNYLIVLLYDLQERVEAAHADGEISQGDTTSIVDKIVEIKQEILDGKSRSNIIPLLNELKELWRASAAEIE